MENVDLVIFDMDGLMFDTERKYYRETERAMRENGITVDMQVLRQAIGSWGFDLNKFFLKVPEGIDAEKILDDVVPNAVADMCRSGVPVKPGLIDLLEELREKKIRMAVATSTPHYLSDRLLAAAGVTKYFDLVLTRAEVRRGKPYPDIFLETCAREKASPERALVLEDSDNGGRAAKSAGIRYIIIPDTKQPAEAVAASAYAVLGSLAEVIRLV